MSEATHDQKLRLLALDLIAQLPSDTDDAGAVMAYMRAEYRGFVLADNPPRPAASVAPIHEGDGVVVAFAPYRTETP